MTKQLKRHLAVLLVAAMILSSLAICFTAAAEVGGKYVLYTEDTVTPGSYMLVFSNDANFKGEKQVLNSTTGTWMKLSAAAFNPDGSLTGTADTIFELEEDTNGSGNLYLKGDKYWVYKADNAWGTHSATQTANALYNIVKEDGTNNGLAVEGTYKFLCANVANRWISYNNSGGFRTYQTTSAYHGYLWLYKLDDGAGEDPDYVDPVTASPASGTSLLLGDTITLDCATENATIYYKLNDGAFAEYNDPIVLTELPATITAYAEADGFENRAIQDTFNYTQLQVAAPTASVADGGEVEAGQVIAFSCATAGATISYSVDGAAFTDGTSYTIENPDCKIELKATLEGALDSAVATYTYKAADLSLLASWAFTASSTSIDANNGRRADTATLTATAGDWIFQANGATVEGGWAPDGDLAKYILIGVDASNYENLTLDLSLRATNTGPKSLKAYYSIDGGDFLPVTDAEVDYTLTTSLRAQPQLALPEAAKNGVLLIKLEVVGNESVNGSTITTGNLNINNISLKGDVMSDVPGIDPTEILDAYWVEDAAVKSTPSYLIVETGTDVTDLTFTYGASKYSLATKFIKESEGKKIWTLSVSLGTIGTRDYIVTPYKDGSVCGSAVMLETTVAAAGSTGRADYTAFNEAVAAIETLDYSVFSYDARTYLRGLKAQVNLGISKLDQEILDAQAAPLLAAMANVSESLNEYLRPASYTEIKKLVSAANKLDADDYSAESWNTLQDALEAVVYGLDITKQADVNAAVEALREAIDNLDATLLTILNLTDTIKVNAGGSITVELADGANIGSLVVINESGQKVGAVAVKGNTATVTFNGATAGSRTLILRAYEGVYLTAAAVAAAPESEILASVPFRVAFEAA